MSDIKTKEQAATEAAATEELLTGEIDKDELAVEETNMVIKFKKPYMFEHVEYTQIDLSGLDNLTAQDMISINRVMSRTSAGIDVMPEVSLEYACNIAARATKLPVEFYLQLPPREAIKIKNRVMVFLFGSE